jgi:hypothetical protein
MTNASRAALYSISAAAFIFAVSGTASAQGMAMDKPMAGEMTQKTLSENAKLAVIDMVAKPGETSPMQARPMRVVHVISGGTFERTFADGKKEVIEEKAGETKILDVPKPYALKNIGKTTIHGVIVSMK